MNFRCFILAAAGIALAARAEDRDLRPRFEYVREMDSMVARGQHGRLLIPGDVFGRSYNFPNDLRILDENGAQWPIFLHIPNSHPEREILVPEILNQSYVQGRTPFLQFDLVLPPSINGTMPVHSQIDLATSGKDYIRRVEVYSYDVHDQLALMATGHLTCFAQQSDAHNRQVNYPASDARRLHVRIYPNAQNMEETFSLNSVRLICRAAVEAARERVNATELQVPESEKENDAEVRIFDLAFENRPVDQIVFEVDNHSFARSVSVYGRNSATDPWVRLGGGVIHAQDEDRKPGLKLRRSRCRFLKLQVFHHDDLPLEINSIRLEAIPRYLVFEAASDKSAALYYGAWGMPSAKHDLRDRIQPGKIEEMQLVSLGESRRNDIAEIHPLRKHIRLIGVLAVGAVSLLVIWILVSMLKQQGLPKES